MPIAPSDIVGWLMPIVGFMAVYMLQGIKTEIKEVKDSVRNLENDLRSGVTGLDRRVTRIETICTHEHGSDLQSKDNAP